jgi:hypothetical protein
VGDGAVGDGAVGDGAWGKTINPQFPIRASIIRASIIQKPRKPETRFLEETGFHSFDIMNGCDGIVERRDLSRLYKSFAIRMPPDLI